MVNVGKYAIHRSYGVSFSFMFTKHMLGQSFHFFAEHHPLDVQDDYIKHRLMHIEIIHLLNLCYRGHVSKFVHLVLLWLNFGQTIRLGLLLLMVQKFG